MDLDMTKLKKVMDGIKNLVSSFSGLAIELVLGLIVVGVFIGSVVANNIPNVDSTINTTISGLGSTFNTWAGYLTDGAGLALGFVVIVIIVALFMGKKGGRSKARVA